MALQPGTKLGPYEILAPIGAGGMGEVYKAADVRLNRTVAIKVLPAQFSENLEMKQRFEREARTIGALRHPHICVLYDVGRQEGADFLVMEYLEGETLAERLTRGALPLDEAMKVAIELADALDKAHRQSVTHRDLKPGNIMLTEGGAKLLDFGLAKLKQGPQSGNTPAPDATTPGTILGTMQYMAPEQLEGIEADARTDIFAFGAILYEMLTGKRAFAGKSQAQLIAAIVSSDPEPLSKSQPMAPPALEYVIRRCLAKDPEQRLQTAWDLVCQLQWIAEGGTEMGIPARLVGQRRKRGQLARLALALVSLLVATMAVPAFLYLRGGPASLETRFLINVPDMPVPQAASISPSGQWVAYSGRDGSSTAVFARPIGSETAQRLAGTEGAGDLFWSADSRMIAFFAGGKLKKIEAAGGPPQNICDTPDLEGGTWNADNVILFASSKGLQRVTALGGDATPLTVGQSSPDTHRLAPYFLPDGRHFLYLETPAEAANGAIYVGSLDSKDATRLVAAQSYAVYAEPGYLLFHREGTLYAQPFNARKLSLTGDAIRIADRLPSDSKGAAAFAASLNGTLIFRSALSAPTANGSPTIANIVSQPLLWVDHSGLKPERAGPPGGWAGQDLSPDGKRLAVHRHDADGGDIWLFEVGRDTPSKFTFDASQENASPIWSPNGDRIAFGSRRNGKWGIYVKLANNTGTEELLSEDADNLIMPMSWAPDNSVVYWTSNPKTLGDIGILPLGGDRKTHLFLNSAADERNPQVSPDGKWIAYSSNATGRTEVYIQSFPTGPGKWQISVNGGLFPRWRHDGKELYFLSIVSIGNIMASDIRVNGASIERGVPHALFQTGYVNGVHSAGSYHAYSVTANGERFLIAQPENVISALNPAAANRGGGIDFGGVVAAVSADRHSGGSATATSVPINVILDWTALLRK
jgi:Tol biopolymer transport system component/predicted Ser/Thr protein kinase